MDIENSAFIKSFKKLSNNGDVSRLVDLKKIKDNSLLVIQPFFYNLCNSSPAAQRWCRTEQKSK